MRSFKVFSITVIESKTVGSTLTGIAQPKDLARDSTAWNSPYFISQRYCCVFSVVGMPQLLSKVVKLRTALIHIQAAQGAIGVDERQCILLTLSLTASHSPLLTILAGIVQSTSLALLPQGSPRIRLWRENFENNNLTESQGKDGEN